MVQVVKKTQPKKGKGGVGLGGKKTKRGNRSATIVVVTTSCGIARSGWKLKRNFVPPWEKTSPAPFAHMDGSPGWNLWTNSRRQRGRRLGTSQENVDYRGDCRVGMKMGETGELEVKLLWGNAMLPARGSGGAAGYDLCAASKCVIPSRGKGTIDTGLAVSLPLGTYARIAPRSRLAIRNFIDVGARVVDSDYNGEIKVVLFNHSAEGFAVQAGDRIAQLILERVETPHVKRWPPSMIQTVEQEDLGVLAPSSSRNSPHQKIKRVQRKRILYPHHQDHDHGKRRTRLTWWSSAEPGPSSTS